MPSWKPQENIARNVLEEIGVPSDSTERTFKLILEGAKELGLIREMKGSMYVDLDGIPSIGQTKTETQINDSNNSDEEVADANVELDSIFKY